MKKAIGTTLLLVLVDLIAATVSWGAFYYFRKVYVEKMPLEFSSQFYLGILIIPLFWVTLYTLFGTYFDVLRHYLMKIISLTFKSVFLGTIIIFFTAIIDDEIEDYNSYYTQSALFFLYTCS